MYYNTARWDDVIFLGESLAVQREGTLGCTWVHFKWQKSYFTCWWDLDKKWKETVVTRLKGIFGIWITVLFILHKKTATPVWTIMYLTLWSILKKGSKFVHGFCNYKKWSRQFFSHCKTQIFCYFQEFKTLIMMSNYAFFYLKKGWFFFF